MEVAPSIVIRTASEADAASLLALRQALDAETQFMLLEPGERSGAVETQRARLASMLAAANSTVLLAVEAGGVVGFLQARGGDFRRNRHVADVVVGVLQRCSGRGVGRTLFAALDAWAPRHGITRLELTVMAHNERARRLYERVGFVVEGVKRGSLRVDGRDVDELLMAKRPSHAH
jgi:RimJ/RimL family protein N-acetyltransferase